MSLADCIKYTMMADQVASVAHIFDDDFDLT